MLAITDLVPLGIMIIVIEADENYEEPTSLEEGLEELSLVPYAASDLRELGQRFNVDFTDFYREFINPKLRELRNVDAPSAEQLKSLFDDEGLRRCAFLRIGAHGMPHESFPGEQRLLISALIPHIKDDEAQCLALEHIANTAASSYPELYQQLGEHCRDECLSGIQTTRMANAFLAYNCHSVAHDPVISPWVEYYSAQRVGIHHQAYRELGKRVYEKRHLSSYDHLLEVLCRTESEFIDDILQALLTPLKDSYRTESQHPPMSQLLDVGSYFARTLFTRALPAVPLGGLVVSMASGATFLHSSIAMSAILGIACVAHGVLGATIHKNNLVENANELQKFYQGHAYQTCVDSVYKKFMSQGPLERHKDFVELIKSSTARSSQMVS